MISSRPNKDWASIGGIVIGISLITLFFVEKYVKELSGATQTVLFIFIVAVIFYSSFTLFRRYKTTSTLSVQDLILFGGVIALMVFGILKFNIFPQFSIASIASQNIASIFGGI